MSVDFGTLTPLSVHPASPVLLTKNGPLGILFGHSSPSFGSQQAHSHSNPTTSGADQSMMRRQTHARSHLFHSALGFATRRLARMLHSLVRVSRRVGWDRLGASDLSAHRDCAATPTLCSASTAIAVPTGPTQSWQPSGHAACAARAKAATLLSLQRVAPTGPEPRPEELSHLPHRPPGAPETAADWSTRYYSGGQRAVPASRRSRGDSSPRRHSSTCCVRRGPSRPHSLPSQRFHALFDSLFKVLFIFPSQYLFTIGLVPVFSLRWSLPPTLGCNPNQPDSPKRPHVPQSVTPTHRAITFSGAPFLSDFGRTLQGRPFSRLQFADATHRRLKAWAVPASLTTTRGILVSFFSSAY